MFQQNFHKKAPPTRSQQPGFADKNQEEPLCLTILTAHIFRIPNLSAILSTTTQTLGKLLCNITSKTF